MRTLCLLALSAASLASAAAMADIYVIAHPSVTLTPEEAKEVFLGEKQLAGSMKIVPFDNAGAQATFLERVYRMDVNKYNTVWMKKGFREGLTPPIVKGTDVEVLLAVRSTQGAVGYVSSPPTGVRVISKY